MRQYETLDMFLHAEALPPPETQLEDDQLVAFIRMGIDFTDNFYQIEVPLKVSAPDATSPRQIWIAENDMDLPLELLQDVKSTVLGNDSFSNLELNFFDEELNISNDNKAGRHVLDRRTARRH